MNSSFRDFINNTEQSFTNVKESFLKLDDRINALNNDLTSRTKTNSFQTENIPKFDEFGNISDSTYKIDDNFLDSKILWSSEKIYSLIPKFSGLQNNLTIFNNNNEIVDSTFKIDDSSQPDVKVIYSSAKNQELINNLQTQLQNIVGINDSTINPSSVWSSEKVNSEFTDKIQGTQFLAKFVNGKLRDTTILEEDVMLKNIPINANNLTTLNSSGQVVESQYKIDDVSTPSANVVYSSLKYQELENKINSSSLINDVQTSTTSVWSSNKTNTELLDKIQGTQYLAQFVGGKLRDTNILAQDVMLKNIPTGVNNLTVLNSTGQVVETNFKVDDFATPSPNVIWTSDKIKTNLLDQIQGTQYLAQFVNGNLRDTNILAQDVMLKSVPVNANNLVTLNSSGQAVESSYIVDDTAAPSASVLYTSLKIGDVSNKADKVIPGVVNDLAKIDASGQYQDSGYRVDDTAAPSASVLYTSVKFNELENKLNNVSLINDTNITTNTTWSSDKINNLVQGTQYLATFVNGNLRDSNILQQDVMLKNIPTGVNNLTVLNSTGQVVETNFKVDDFATPSPNVIWTSDMVQRKIFTDKRSDVTSNNILGPNTHQLTFSIPYDGIMIFNGSVTIQKGIDLNDNTVQLKINGINYSIFGNQANQDNYKNTIPINGSISVLKGNLTMDFVQGSFDSLQNIIMVIIVI